MTINKQFQISIQTMTDYHLESFIKCPYRFYYQHVLSVNTRKIKWRQAVQFIINQVVHKFYQLTVEEQHKLSALRLIESQWSMINSSIFDSKYHYYQVLAQTTDHLLQLLTAKDTQVPPIFLYEKLSTYIEELETQLSLTLDVTEWSEKSFTIKKFLLEADEEMIHLYNHLIVVFSYKAFGKLPEKIEVVTLLKGETFTYSPTVNDLVQGIMYLKYMKKVLLDPTDYERKSSIKECNSCPFVQECEKSTGDSPELDLLH
ncbi:hypothetical protein IMZ08_00040 [Bacillus luteolus]|uniref:PD-(D/E)XK endonuclease-like domain-containing protein n=1 Tax=Litchfieldia luteola TaxID=682179 RepID=A0ABR9QD57_9BACI|nr:PD-(D/E)XK nuclease family protein [Cytobacillus luteolus]MBE4906444.1 hypothetical protein [Cytobacillus luteolus]MBP1941232.1 CRISPR/Cas system-associated exonuclease Cas4 (RecB family) [Cytobacillus luteolus]